MVRSDPCRRAAAEAYASVAPRPRSTIRVHEEPRLRLGGDRDRAQARRAPARVGAALSRSGGGVDRHAVAHGTSEERPAPRRLSRARVWPPRRRESLHRDVGFVAHRAHRARRVAGDATARSRRTIDAVVRSHPDRCTRSPVHDDQRSAVARLWRCTATPSARSLTPGSSGDRQIICHGRFETDSS